MTTSLGRLGRFVLNLYPFEYKFSFAVWDKWTNPNSLEEPSRSVSTID